MQWKGFGEMADVFDELEWRKGTVEALREVIADIENGEVTGILAVTTLTNAGTGSVLSTHPRQDRRLWLGILDIAKQEIVNDSLEAGLFVLGIRQ